MKINAIGLFADTARSQGYAQALLQYGYKLEKAIFISKPDGVVKGKVNKSDIKSECLRGTENLLKLDLSIPLKETLYQLSDNIIELSTGTVNSPEVIEKLSNTDADVIIYSGFGGEIVSSRVLNTAPPMLHMHSGYLPAYRGSTTIYYSLLEEQQCAVSAIFLSKKIDTGDILKRVWYPKPAPGTDIDYYYDTAIRADTLLKVIKDWQDKGSFEVTASQSEKEGASYYVIHPVLKHLALLSLEEKEE